MRDLCIKKAKPPPLSCFLSFLTSVYCWDSASLDLSVNFVSCRAAILMLFSFIQLSISVHLFFIPLQLNCSILMLDLLVWVVVVGRVLCVVGWSLGVGIGVGWVGGGIGSGVG